MHCRLHAKYTDHCISPYIDIYISHNYNVSTLFFLYSKYFLQHKTKTFLTLLYKNVLNCILKYHTILFQNTVEYCIVHYGT